MMIYSRRIAITLLSAASCFQFAGGTYVLCDSSNLERRLDVRTITTIDGCESIKYGIWLFVGSGHINLIGEPIMDNSNKEDTAPSHNGDHEDPKHGISSSPDKTTSCPTLVFDDGGKKLDKVMADIRSIVILEDDSSNGEQDPLSTSNEDHATAWKKDAMRLHKTSHKNANNKTTSAFVLPEVTAAYNHAMGRLGDYDIFNNNCATFILNMMAELEIKVDDHMIKFAASELYKNHTVIEPVLKNQTFMKDIFLEFDHDATTTTPSSHTTGFIRSSTHHQAQTATGMVADSLEGTELFVAHYVKKWRANHRRLVEEDEGDGAHNISK